MNNEINTSAPAISDNSHSPIIGVFGGTFDPIHSGHLYVAQKLLQQLPLTEIRFIPCYQPSHRQTPLASPLQRLEMIRLAVGNRRQILIDDCEIKRQGISYTADTLRYLKQQQTNAHLCLIVGSDAWQHLPQWHQSKQISQLAHVIVINRLNHPVEPAVLATDKKLIQQHDHGIHLFCSIPPCDISATNIRQAPIETIKKNLSPKVYQYIVDHQLYCLFY